MPNDGLVTVIIVVFYQRRLITRKNSENCYRVRLPIVIAVVSMDRTLTAATKSDRWHFDHHYLDCYCEEVSVVEAH